MDINEDNQSAISMTKNSQHHGRAKHIDIKLLSFVGEQVENRVVILKYCPSANMLAYVFSKGLSQDHPELSGCITTLSVCNTGGCKLLCSNGHLDRSR